MKHNKPPFEINEKMLSDVIEIAELVGKVSIGSGRIPLASDRHS